MWSPTTGPPPGTGPTPRGWWSPRLPIRGPMATRPATSEASDQQPTNNTSKKVLCHSSPSRMHPHGSGEPGFPSCPTAGRRLRPDSSGLSELKRPPSHTFDTIVDLCHFCPLFRHYCRPRHFRRHCAALIHPDPPISSLPLLLPSFRRLLPLSVVLSLYSFRSTSVFFLCTSCFQVYALCLYSFRTPSGFFQVYAMLPTVLL